MYFAIIEHSLQHRGSGKKRICGCADVASGLGLGLGLGLASSDGVKISTTR